MIETNNPDEEWTHEVDEDWIKQMNFLQNQT